MKNLPHAALLTAALFLTGMVFYNSPIIRNAIPAVMGEENEDKPETKDEEDEKDEAKKEEDEKDHEDKKNDEDEKDEIKTKKDKTSISSKKTENKEDEDEDDKAGKTDEEDDEDADGNEDDEIDEADENPKDTQEGISELNRDMRKIESRINVLKSNGFSVASFATKLLEIKVLVGQAEAKMLTAPAEAGRLVEIADHKLESLQKLVKMTLGDGDEDSDDDATEKIKDLSNNIAKIEVKLNIYSSKGVDVSALKSSLNEIKDLLSQAREKVASGDVVSAEALAKVADKKMETLKHAMELAYGDDDEEDGDEADEYKNKVAKFVHNLKQIGDMDEGIGQQVRVVAQAQNDSIAKVENSINDINQRGGFMKFLVGPKYDSIAEIQTAITENQTRINILVETMNRIADPAVKLVLQDQIKQFQQENVKLQTFAAESESGVSLFGWLVKMFS